MAVATTVDLVTAPYPPREAIRAWFDAGAYARGTVYARQGAVLSARAREQGHGLVVVGQVRGTATLPYDVEVGTWRTSDGWRVDAECSCPVGVDCKHAAAVLVSLSEDADPPTPAWEQTLGSALEQLETPQTPVALRTPLALMIDHKTPSNRWGGGTRRHQLTVRPVQRGVNGTWVKAGVSWSQVRHMAYQGRHDPAHVELLTTMEAAFLHGYSNHDPQLLNLERLLWPLLRQCTEIGLELVPGTSLTSIEVTGPRRLSSDVAAVGDEVPGGTLELRTGILLDDEEWWPAPGRAVEFIGHPAHGVALLREVPPPGRRTTRSRWHHSRTTSAPTPNASSTSRSASPPGTADSSNRTTCHGCDDGSPSPRATARSSCPALPCHVWSSPSPGAPGTGRRPRGPGATTPSGSPSTRSTGSTRCATSTPRRRSSTPSGATPT